MNFQTKKRYIILKFFLNTFLIINFFKNNKESSLKIRILKIKLRLLLKKIEKLDPWYSLMNYIERTFGLSHLSFFKFIQWLFLFNLVVTIISTVFVILPQVIYSVNILSPNQTYLDETFNKTFNKTEECPIILTNRSVINIFTDRVERELLLTECCTNDYKMYLKNEIEKKNSFDNFLDIIQGTVII
jgi:hypothetical protein